MTTAMHQILVVEDDAGIRDVLHALLGAAHYRVIEAESANRGEIEARAHKPDAMLVDLGLPDRDGLDLIARVREWSSMPIIVLSARTAEEQKIAALDAGADDYVTKPFGAAELLARLRAALRRSTTTESGTHQLLVGDFQVDLARREVHGPREIHLTPLEYRVLGILARTPGAIVKHEKLLREAWGPVTDGDSGSLRVTIRHLRQKLERDPTRPRCITTEIGLGYRLIPSDEAAI